MTTNTTTRPTIAITITADSKEWEGYEMTDKELNTLAEYMIEQRIEADYPEYGCEITYGTRLGTGVELIGGSAHDLDNIKDGVEDIVRDVYNDIAGMTPDDLRASIESVSR